MLSKRLWIIVSFLLLAVVIFVATIYLSQLFAPDNPDQIRNIMKLTEMAKSPIIRHSDVTKSTIIISYPKPQLTVNDKILEDLKCPFEEWGGRYCVSIRDQGQSESQGCFSIYTADSLLGGLQPAYSLAACSVSDGKYVYQNGCMLSMGTAFIIARQGKYEKIDSLSQLKAVFSPIESENEALSYAIAATGYFALYETEPSPDEEYFVEKLENTHVVVSGNEYIVRLYDYSLCGCGKHKTIAIDVAVDHQGNIREIYREVVYQEKSEKCID